MKDKKLVIMLSGGLDSTLAWYYAVKEKKYKPEDIVCIWFNVGQPYAKKEEKVIDSLPFKVEKIHLDLIRAEWDNVPGIGDGEQIIPARNMIFATIAATFGEEVWLMALDGERHSFAKERDKSELFFEKMNSLLTYVYHITRKETKLATPFRGLTKTELVGWALKNDIPEDVLLGTSTCYDETVRNCGVCPTCFKRWVAMTNNGIKEEYEVNPGKLVLQKGTWNYEYMEKIQSAWDRQDFTHYSEKRCSETLTAMKLYTTGTEVV